MTHFYTLSTSSYHRLAACSQLSCWRRIYAHISVTVEGKDVKAAMSVFFCQCIPIEWCAQTPLGTGVQKMNKRKGMNFPLCEFHGVNYFFIQKAESNYFVIFHPLNVTRMQETHSLNLNIFWPSQGWREASPWIYTECSEFMWLYFAFHWKPFQKYRSLWFLHSSS